MSFTAEQYAPPLFIDPSYTARNGFKNSFKTKPLFDEHAIILDKASTDFLRVPPPIYDNTIVQTQPVTVQANVSLVAAPETDAGISNASLGLMVAVVAALVIWRAQS